MFTRLDRGPTDRLSASAHTPTGWSDAGCEVLHPPAADFFLQTNLEQIAIAQQCLRSGTVAFQRAAGGWLRRL